MGEIVGRVSTGNHAPGSMLPEEAQMLKSAIEAVRDYHLLDTSSTPQIEGASWSYQDEVAFRRAAAEMEINAGNEGYAYTDSPLAKKDEQ